MRADFSANLIDVDRLGQVLESTLAQIVENERRVPADMVKQHSAHPHGSGRSCLLEARSQINAVPHQIVPINGHVRYVHAEAHLQRFDVRPVDSRKRCAYLAAQRSALIGLGNSASEESPALLNILPSSEATFSAIRLWQQPY